MGCGGLGLLASPDLAWGTLQACDTASKISLMVRGWQGEAYRPRLRPFPDMRPTVPSKASPAPVELWVCGATMLSLRSRAFSVTCSAAMQQSRPECCPCASSGRSTRSADWCGEAATLENDNWRRVH
jgi:hypothetical protein